MNRRPSLFSGRRPLWTDDFEYDLARQREDEHSPAANWIAGVCVVLIVASLYFVL